MWVTRSEREWIRRRQALEMARAAQRAEARFALVSRTLGTLLSDSGSADRLSRLGLTTVALGRSSRLPVNGMAEGLAVLEGVVLSGVTSALLSDTTLVRWLSAQYPAELAALHKASEEGQAIP